MIMKKIVVIIFLLIFANLEMFSQNIGLNISEQNQVIQEINKVATNLKSLTCEFIQIKHISLMNEEITSKGRMYYSQWNRLRWEYLSPYSYVFLLDGTTIFLKSVDKTDKIDIRNSKIFQEIARIMMNSVTGKCLVDTSDFDVAISNLNLEWKAQLVPQRKEMKQMFTHICLYFDKSANMIRKIELFEKSGDKTTIQLKNIITNRSIDEDVFVID